MVARYWFRIVSIESSKQHVTTYHTNARHKLYMAMEEIYESSYESVTYTNGKYDPYVSHYIYHSDSYLTYWCQAPKSTKPKGSKEGVDAGMSSVEDQGDNSNYMRKVSSLNSKKSYWLSSRCWLKLCLWL
jgi:hypothetical protein